MMGIDNNTDIKNDESINIDSETKLTLKLALAMMEFYKEIFLSLSKDHDELKRLSKPTWKKYVYDIFLVLLGCIVGFILGFFYQ